jgi:hypothetical protein
MGWGAANTVAVKRAINSRQDKDFIRRIICKRFVEIVTCDLTFKRRSLYRNCAARRPLRFKRRTRWRRQKRESRPGTGDGLLLQSAESLVLSSTAAQVIDDTANKARKPARHGPLGWCPCKRSVIRAIRSCGFKKTSQQSEHRENVAQKGG